MNNLRGSFVKFDVLIGGGVATIDSPHPISQKNKPKSNRPRCTVYQGFNRTGPSERRRLHGFERRERWLSLILKMREKREI